MARMFRVNFCALVKRIASYYLLPKDGNPNVRIGLVASYPQFLLKLISTKKYNMLTKTYRGDMSYQSIIEYLESLARIYVKSKRQKKSLLLDQACEITGRHRKSLVRILNSEIVKNNKKGKCGARVKYPEELLLPHLKFLWISMERISPKRMKAAFKDWLPFYNEEDVTYEVKKLLKEMSVSTLYRFLKKIKKLESFKQKGLCSTSPARYMKNKVPINTLDSVVKEPGFVQADTVAHCGNSLEGKFINSITLTDIHSTWTENTHGGK